LELNSLSKSFNMAGWRVGMVSGHAESIQAVLKVKSNMDSGMFFGLQHGAIAALQQSSDWFAIINKVYTKRRDLMEQLIRQLGLEYAPTQVGMFLWAKIPNPNIKATDFTEQLLKKYHIFIAPGTIFGSQGEGYVRFSLCVNEDQIQTALNRILK
ncbi:MAG: pyridoxal phosphate-dependent aminotransferase, partial [Flavobacteriaceae bacterium]